MGHPVQGLLMPNDQTPRRDFLRISGASLAGAALHSRSAEAQAGPTPNAAIFDVKFFGATGDGKTIDTPSINRAIEAAAAAGGGTVRFRLEIICAIPFVSKATSLSTSIRTQ